MRIMQASPADVPSVAALRHALWPDAPLDELFVEARDLIHDQGRNAAVFLAFADNHASAVGMAEVTLRSDYVNGCEGNRIAFLEGVYVAPTHRRQGVAQALVQAAEQFGQRRGCTEFASDALLDNEASHAFHAAAGFQETERVVYFRKLIRTKAA